MRQKNIKRKNNNYRKPFFLRFEQQNSYNALPLPAATGRWPYRLNATNVLPALNDRQQKLVFHMVGDTGSARHSDFQRLVAGEMAQQAKEDKTDFMYHLGDIVYNFGEAQEYPRQFFEPYEIYPSSIFAIAGNHDGDINPDTASPYQSLDAFMDAFCSTEPRRLPFSAGSQRKSMIQPNVYWTLQTPLANFIGLYGNISKFGSIDPDQKKWFIEELKAAASEKKKALLICLHHAPYSADINHGSSQRMIAFLEEAYKESGVKPDVVFSGHVHNYQRFIKQYEDGKMIPYIVAGAGGYADLHPIAKRSDEDFIKDSSLFNAVHLENFCDDRYGFLKITIEKTNEELSLIGEYYTIRYNAFDSQEPASSLFERFKIPFRNKEHLLVS